jgi:hypothetical protein
VYNPRGRLVIYSFRLILNVLFLRINNSGDFNSSKNTLFPPDIMLRAMAVHAQL